MARVRLTRQRVKRACFLIPAMAILGALLWPVGSAGPGPTTVVAIDCGPLPGLPICDSPSPSPTKSVPPPPRASPTATATQRLEPPPPQPGAPPPPVQPPDGGGSGSAIGSASGPPPPPSVNASLISMASEPANPDPGAVATLVITVSGQNGPDKYGVSGKNVDVTLKERPGPDAKLDAGSVITDPSGAATVKLRLSQTRGRHVVQATSEGLSTEWVTDTLAGANLVSRARHGGEIDTVPVAPPNNAAIFFAGAGFVLLLGFAWPHLIGLWRSQRRRGPLWSRRAGLRASSKRTS